MKTLKFKTIEEFQDKITGCETTELADVLLEAIQRGMKNNNKKVTVCDVAIEEEDELFTLYSPSEEWPVALKGCMEAFIKVEEYEKCIIIQDLEKEYEIKKLVAGDTKPTRNKRSSKGNSNSTK
jgi:putative lipoic acid-binding regulatory protein